MLSINRITLNLLFKICPTEVGPVGVVRAFKEEMPKNITFYDMGCNIVVLPQRTQSFCDEVWG